MTKEDFLKTFSTPTDDYRALRKLEAQMNPAQAQAPEPQKQPVASWETLSEEGQLAVDVYETSASIVIVAGVAGVKPDQLDITVTGDMVTIRGHRTDEVFEAERQYFYQECYFGSFSRTIVLPVHIAGDRSEASLKNGLLTIRIPKVSEELRVHVRETS